MIDLDRSKVAFLAGNMTTSILEDSGKVRAGLREILNALILNIEYFRTEHCLTREEILEVYNKIADDVERKLELESKKVVQFRRDMRN
jgi:hypothetical protein